LDNFIDRDFSTVGIIANPLSGKDIRRLVASASVVSTHAKANELVKLYSGLVSEGIKKIVVMPDLSDITKRSREKFNDQVETEILKTTVIDHEETTIQAAKEMERRKLGCVVIFGGDGTCRLASKFLANTPILAISTGTNNLFPKKIDGTVAGMVVGKFYNLKNKKDYCFKEQKLDIYINKKYKDSALVDAVISDIPYIGSKAIWNMDNVKEMFISKVIPEGIGFSSIAFHLTKKQDLINQGIYINFNDSRSPMIIKAPIAPGKIEEVLINKWKIFDSNDLIEIALKSGTIALDGERTIEFSISEKPSVKLNLKGPISLIVEKILSV
tara:strand:- start:70 stop:1050 length:981 start_codon:yes stop_codon:yes gene_type:complete